MKRVLLNLFWLFLPIIAGSLVGILISPGIDYVTLNQPPLAPPSILFPIVWSILYLLMGISYFIYRRNHADKIDILLYYTQLIVNLLWSVIFFLFKWRFFSIIWIVFLDILVILLIRRFLNKEKISAWLLIPYLIWILFATYLTIGIYVLN